LISALSLPCKIKSPGIARGFFVQARKELPSAGVSAARVPGWPAESGLRWGANHCNMERF